MKLKTVLKLTASIILCLHTFIHTGSCNDLYEIVGKSLLLNKSNEEKMTSWRKSAIDYAKLYPSAVFIHGQTNNMKVSLTFDDGADTLITPAILDILKNKKVKGNFFVIGNSTENSSNTIKRIYDEGNLILNHTFSHKHLTTLTSNEIIDEVKTTEDKIFKITGVRPALIRPPYGDINDSVITTLTNQWKIILWSIDTLDWTNKTAESILKNVEGIRPGDIVLMHCNNNKEATVEALPKMIDYITKRGYQIVGIDELLSLEAYY